MIIEMLTTSATPEGHMHAGQCYNIPKKQADTLIAGGYARKVKDTPERISEPAKAVDPNDPAGWHDE